MRLDTPAKRLAARAVPTDWKELRYDALGAVIYANQTANGITHAKAYKGTTCRPAWYYSFKTSDRFESYATEWLLGLQQSLDFKAQRQSARTGECPWTVGQILECSWGYDQTNIDYYEVISVRGKLVDIQAITTEIIDARGPYGDTVIPTRRRRGEIHKSKRPQTYDNGKTWYLRMTSYSFAYPWDGKMGHQTDPSFGH